MSSIPSVHEGTVTAKVLGNHPHGRVGGTHEPRRGWSVRAPIGCGPVSGQVTDSAEGSAISELGGLISSLGMLSSQAQSLPLTPPTLPGLPQNQNYRPQTTDYAQFADEQN